ncbi:molybdenum cofactor biosynthesis small subunit domain protein [Mycobacterium xenopi 3993]|nr:molybdenum cofactor biosynthesis small subunit domain protein [Mycobacterium xenopi 3993]
MARDEPGVVRVTVRYFAAARAAAGADSETVSVRPGPPWLTWSTAWPPRTRGWRRCSAAAPTCATASPYATQTPRFVPARQSTYCRPSPAVELCDFPHITKRSRCGYGLISKPLACVNAALSWLFARRRWAKRRGNAEMTQSA